MGESTQTISIRDQVNTVKAQVHVLSTEFEKKLVKAAIQCVTTESNALAACFSTNVKHIDAHVHPFQQFASTCYPHVDKKSHLDVVSKLAEV